MKKIIVLCMAIIANNSEIVYSQNNCFSMENYPTIDWSGIHDSAGTNEALESYEKATVDYFNSMINCPIPIINAISVDGDTISK